MAATGETWTDLDWRLRSSCVLVRALAVRAPEGRLRPLYSQYTFTTQTDSKEFENQIQNLIAEFHF